MNFSPDPRMTCFDGCETYESFLKVMTTEIWLKPEVHEDVHNSFRVIKKLIEHSYYEYEFYDVAVTKALMTLEMALKIRYKEINEEDWDRKTKKGEPKRDLNNLINWFKDNKYFEIEDSDYLKKVKNIRNYFAHPNKFGFGGPIMGQWIEHPMDLINDIYENIELRKKRFIENENISQKLQQFLPEGSVLQIGQKEEIIYLAHLIFIDNKEAHKLLR